MCFGAVFLLEKRFILCDLYNDVDCFVPYWNLCVILECSGLTTAVVLNQQYLHYCSCNFAV